MSDSMGRYTLAELRDKVRRAAFAELYTVDASGDESGSPLIDTLISNKDLDDSINKAIRGLGMETAQLSPMVMASHIDMPIAPAQQYAFPSNMLVLQQILYRPSRTASANGNYPPSTPISGTWATNLPDQGWVPLPLNNAQLENTSEFSYRREGSFFILNWIPDRAAPMALRIRYLAWVNSLVKTTDVIKGFDGMVLALQEVVIYESARDIMATKRKQVTDEINSLYDMWHTRYATVISAAINPDHVSATSLYVRRARSRW